MTSWGAVVRPILGRLIHLDRCVDLLVELEARVETNGTSHQEETKRDDEHVTEVQAARDDVDGLDLQWMSTREQKVRWCDKTSFFVYISALTFVKK
jgi:hypothetical protein